MSKKLRVGVLFGGKSAEHEVSLQSARTVIESLDEKKYHAVSILITKTGAWTVGGKPVDMLRALSDADVIFPALHGPYGEDGSIQGLLKLANVPFVGAGVLGSAVGMDKDVMKRLLHEAGIPIGTYITMHSGEQISFTKAKKILGLPLFIKPANLGSSVGVNKVTDQKSFDQALKEALRFDTKIIIEEYIEAREIECAVLGNEDPTASIPGEVAPIHDFYSYEAKYLDENGARLDIPAKLSKQQAKQVQALAVKTFKTLECAGMARVDFFLKKDGILLVNEINTLPGFTAISMYPKLWEASGIPRKKLVDKLITLAIERHQKEQKLMTTYK